MLYRENSRSNQFPTSLFSAIGCGLNKKPIARLSASSGKLKLGSSQKENVKRVAFIFVEPTRKGLWSNSRPQIIRVRRDQNKVCIYIVYTPRL